MNLEVLPHGFLQIRTSKVICAGKCYVSQETFFCRNLKNDKILLGCLGCLNISCRASPAQKMRGLRVILFQNFSRANFYIFRGTHLVNMFLSYLPVKQIWGKSTVWAVSLARERLPWQHRLRLACDGYGWRLYQKLRQVADLEKKCSTWNC